MTVRTLLVIVLLGAGAVFGVRYAHDRFAAERATYTFAATKQCLQSLAGVAASAADATDGATGPTVVVATSTNNAAVRFYDSAANAAYAKTGFEDSIERTGRPATGLVDQSANAVVGWRHPPTDAERSTLIGCLR
jgi:hypothetical protein